MDIVRADIVKSTAGRDKGKYFFVLAEEEEFLLLADGKTRKLERPKRKKAQAHRLCGPLSVPGGREDQKRRKDHKQ